MAAATIKPMTTKAIALTEKKINMTLDDIIKMSKKPAAKVKKQRVPNKRQNSFTGGVGSVTGGNNAVRGNFLRVRQFMDSRSTIRQGVLAQRRSNFQGNHFPLTTEVVRKAVTAPIHNKPFIHNRSTKTRIGAVAQVERPVKGRSYSGKQQQMPQRKQGPQTLDSLFANMKQERRMKVNCSQPQNNQQGRVMMMRGQSQKNYQHHRVMQQQQQQRGRGRGRFSNFSN